MAEPCDRCHGTGVLACYVGGVLMHWRCCLPAPVAPPVRLRQPPRCRVCGLEGALDRQGLCPEDARLAARQAAVARALEAS